MAPMIAAVVALRGAREGVRAMASGPDARWHALGVALWLVSLLVSFSVPWKPASSDDG